jgi:hypothetical protein
MPEETRWQDWLITIGVTALSLAAVWTVFGSEIVDVVRLFTGR